ncbi:hypothetical protein QPK87_38010 [Kamptonema cortianum]|nr:hypothetical protein [Kamptonema cortianum]
MQQVFGNGFAFMIQEGIRLGAEQFSDGVDHGCTLPQSPFFEKRISSKKIHGGVSLTKEVSFGQRKGSIMAKGAFQNRKKAL